MTKEQMKNSAYHDILLDIYRYIQQFGETKNTEEYWTAAAMTARDTAQKYKGTPVSGFVNSLLLDCLDELQHICDAQTQR